MSEVMKYAFGARYALILMGFFAFYCGFIYNDFMSVPFQNFPTMWAYPTNFTDTNNHLLLKNGTDVYPFGVDWNWYNV